jgi:hypothetical protein
VNIGRRTENTILKGDFMKTADYGTAKLSPVMKPNEDLEVGYAVTVTCLSFFPAERVHGVFSRLKAARGTDSEADGLREFAESMTWLYENRSEEVGTEMEEAEAARLAALGEAAEYAMRTESIEAGHLDPKGEML